MVVFFGYKFIMGALLCCLEMALLESACTCNGMGCQYCMGPGWGGNQMMMNNMGPGWGGMNNMGPGWGGMNNMGPGWGGMNNMGPGFGGNQMFMNDMMCSYCGYVLA